MCQKHAVVSTVSKKSFCLQNVRKKTDSSKVSVTLSTVCWKFSWKISKSMKLKLCLHILLCRVQLTFKLWFCCEICLSYTAPTWLFFFMGFIKITLISIHFWYFFLRTLSMLRDVPLPKVMHCSQMSGMFWCTIYKFTSKLNKKNQDKHYEQNTNINYSICMHWHPP